MDQAPARMATTWFTVLAVVVGSAGAVVVAMILPQVALIVCLIWPLVLVVCFWNRPLLALMGLGSVMIVVDPSLLLAWSAIFCWVAGRDRFRTALFGVAPWLVVMAGSFAGGVHGYFRGTAELRTFGLVRGDRFDLDQETRCWRTSGGCVIPATTWLTDTPNRAAIRAMAAWFGPMPGTYHGPIPDRDEAFGVIADLPAIPAASALSQGVVVDGPAGNQILVPADLLQALCHGSEDGSIAMRIAVPHAGVAAVRIDNGAVTLVDLAKRRRIARYVPRPR